MNERYFRSFWANFVIVAVLAATFCVAIVTTLPSSDRLQTVNNAIYKGSEDVDGVALMFNVYERADNVKAIASIFEDYGMRATFFLGGCWLAKNQNTALTLAAAGFELGNHGYLHRDHAGLTLAQNLEEIKLTERLMDATLSDLPEYANSKLFAPPGGSMGTHMFEAAKQLGYRVIMWTRDTIDWRDHDEQLIFDRATKGLQSGDLILMHPTDCTVAALPRILDYICSQGLSATTVGSLL